jgi:6-phosphogluconolactonase
MIRGKVKLMLKSVKDKTLTHSGSVFQIIRDSHSFRKGLMMQKKGMTLLAVCLVLAGLPGCNSFFSSTSASHVAYVAVPNEGIVAYRIDNSTGLSTLIIGSPFATGNSPFSIQVHPTKQFLYVANTADNTISLFKIDGSSGALTEVMPRTPTGLDPAYLSMDSSGSFLYASNNGSNSISVYSIDSSSGVLTEVAGSPVATNTGPNLLTVSPTGKFLYVLDTNLQLVTVYPISSGALQSGTSFPVGVAPFAMAIDPTEHFMYVVNAGTNTITNGTVSEFTINSASGALTLVPGTGAPTGTTPIAILIHPTGKNLYVANSGTDNISQFSIDSTTGVLTELTTTTVSAGTTPVFMVFDAASGYVDVGNQGSKNITEYSVNQNNGALDTGTLAAVSTLTLTDPPTSMSFGK